MGGVGSWYSFLENGVQEDVSYTLMGFALIAITVLVMFLGRNK